MSHSKCIWHPSQLHTDSQRSRFYPEQEDDPEDESPRFPSVLYYDKQGHVSTAGAEAELDEVIAQAQEEEWVKVQQFVFSNISPLSARKLTALLSLQVQTPLLPSFFHIFNINPSGTYQASTQKVKHPSSPRLSVCACRRRLRFHRQGSVPR